MKNPGFKKTVGKFKAYIEGGGWPLFCELECDEFPQDERIRFDSKDADDLIFLAKQIKKYHKKNK